MKLFVSNILNILGITALIRWVSDRFFGKNYIRVVNYHSTPKSQQATFAKHLAYYRKHYTSVSLGDLNDFFVTGKWKYKKPGLIISFDDGQRTNFDFAYPLLEKYGFVGWFFIPTAFIDLPITEQKAFMVDNQFTKNHTYNDGRYAMNWGEVIELNQKHVIGSHTIHHHEVSVSDSTSILEEEIIVSKRKLEDKLEHEISCFCWVRGRMQSYSAEAARIIKKAGYRFSFMTNTYPILSNTSPLQIQRTNIETRNPLHLVKFQLCGLMDLYYLNKRNKVIKMTSL